MEYTCDICGTAFGKKYNLVSNKKKAKYCIALQQQKKCKGCSDLFGSLAILREHEQSCVSFLHFKIEMLEYQISTLEEENSELKLKMVETGTGRDIYKEEYQAIRDKPTTATSTTTSYTNNSINQKLNAINISTIEPFTIDTVRRRLETGGH